MVKGSVLAGAVVLLLAAALPATLSAGELGSCCIITRPINVSPRRSCYPVTRLVDANVRMVAAQQHGF
jgi:hypothetical protein